MKINSWIPAVLMLLMTQYLSNFTLCHLWRETDYRTMDGFMIGHWMHHFVLSKLVLFTALLTQGVKKAEIISSPSDLPSPDWLTALTVSTNSNFFLSWTSWMRQTYSSAALAKSLCSISRVASAWKQKQSYKCLRAVKYKTFLHHHDDNELSLN